LTNTRREARVRSKLLSSIIASASLIAAAPVAAQSASALSVARAQASVEGEELAGGAGGAVAIALVAGIIAIGVLAAVNGGDDDDDPISA
jgi:hypothetical protein